jgi:hypothetical protein
MIKRRYSKLAQIEKKKNVRIIVIFGSLTIAFLGFLLFLGLPMVAKFAAFLTDLRQSDQPIEIIDNTPPGPPQIEALPEFTNEQKIKVKGQSEAGATVTVVFNNEEKTLVADNDGSFSLTLLLNKGENKLWAKAVDKRGNESAESKRLSIVFDNQPPEITILEPQDQTSFFGEDQKRITLKGETNEECTITINDRLAVVDNNDKFNFVTNLAEGENTFVIKAVDMADNESEESISLNFSP